jgi:hypothetical protein
MTGGSIDRKPADMIAELFAADAFGGVAVDLQWFTHFAARTAIARSVTLVVHGQTFSAIDLN